MEIDLKGLDEADLSMYIAKNLSSWSEKDLRENLIELIFCDQTAIDGWIKEFADHTAESVAEDLGTKLREIFNGTGVTVEFNDARNEFFGLMLADEHRRMDVYYDRDGYCWMTELSDFDGNIMGPRQVTGPQSALFTINDLKVAIRGYAKMFGFTKDDLVL